MKYLIAIFTSLLLLSACSSHLNPENSVVITVKNHSNTDFDTLRITISTDSETIEDLVITKLDAGKKVQLYVDQIEYMFYDFESEFVFFSNAFKGVTKDHEIYGTGYGFCGTGLMFKTVREGSFIATITGVDQENKHMFIDQKKED